MAEYYYNEDGTKIAVLVSVGYGAGWSTWEGDELAYDKRVIEFWLAHHYHDDERYFASYSSKEDVEEFFKSIGYDDLYLGGFYNTVIKWVPIGCRWRINEYDGAESLEILSMDNYNYVPAKGENNG